MKHLALCSCTSKIQESWASLTKELLPQIIVSRKCLTP